MRYRVTHTTRFDYAAPIRYARCNLRLEPVDWAGQHVEAFALAIDPPVTVRKNEVGAYPGHPQRITVAKATRRLTVTATSTIVVERHKEVARDDDPSVSEVAAEVLASSDLRMEAPANYLYASPMIALSPEIAAFCATSLAPDRGIVAAAYDLNDRLRAYFRYDGTATETTTTPAEAFAAKAGVCQDFAQVMIAGLRSAGLPAAYVSGYLRTYPPPGKPRLVGADATHAWVLLWCGATRGWIGFDPTNGIGMGEDHIVTAIGRDYADIAPIDGIFVGTAGQRISVSVDVAPDE